MSHAAQQVLGECCALAESKARHVRLAAPIRHALLNGHRIG
jgi:hypothetical protein